ncbi:hypothetical protein SDC9_185961 [bioreactor metagenome]|uniref:Uncharacterized protein n=1 Tax=bioreactor metagenome TaxID=1076179 RepID=A0A645HHK1_9ZZZZ
MHRAEHIARADPFALFDGRDEMPLLIARKARNFNAARQAIARKRPDSVERPLDAVVNAGDQTRAKLCAHGYADGFHRLTGPKAACFLIDLYGRTVAVNFDDLTDQAAFRHPDHVEHIGVAHTLGNDQRAGHL